MDDQKSGHVPRWVPHPNTTDRWACDILLEGDLETGRDLAYLEDFGDAAYPSALNVVTGNWERGGAYFDRVQAMLWAERVAGLHPRKPGDERPAFYYQPRCQVEREGLDCGDEFKCHRCQCHWCNRPGSDWRPVMCLDRVRPDHG